MADDVTLRVGGAVDDAMIYGRALSAKEIRQLYKAQGGKR